VHPFSDRSPPAPLSSRIPNASTCWVCYTERFDVSGRLYRTHSRVGCLFPLPPVVYRSVSWPHPFLDGRAWSLIIVPLVLSSTDLVLHSSILSRIARIYYRILSPPSVCRVAFARALRLSRLLVDIQQQVGRLSFHLDELCN
jgi:hypothetical protein